MSFVLIDRAFVVSNAMHQSISFLRTNLQKIGSNSYVHNQVFFFFFFNLEY
jgi:DNA-binding winged helix-turn-helix (wHTH) protein